MDRLVIVRWSDNGRTEQMNEATARALERLGKLAIVSQTATKGTLGELLRDGRTG